MYPGGMQSLNYHHLLYFWVVAKEGTIAAACKELHVAQPTISAQLRVLEDSLGDKLFTRVGRDQETAQLVHREARHRSGVQPDSRKASRTLRRNSFPVSL